MRISSVGSFHMPLLVILITCLWTFSLSAHPLHSTHHTVTSGDTLYSIARHYGHSVSEIARWNRLSPPFHVKPGQRLVVADPASFKEIKHIWQSLSQTSNHCPELLDSFPNGGIRMFYCHVKEFLNYEKIQKLAGVPVFLQGPHHDKELQLEASDHFGYYNPDFVKWLTHFLIPALEDKAFRETTQDIYDQFIEPLAQTYYVVHENLVKHPDFLKKEQDAYLEALKSRNLAKDYYEKYFNFSNLYKKGFEGHQVKTSVAFWIRRFIDGTEKEFFTGLTTLMTVYGSELVKKTPHLLWTSTSPVHPQLPNFTFKFFGENQKEMVIIDRIKIYDQEDHELQVIENLNAQTPVEEAFQIEDMNFDGYLDFRLIEFLPMTPNIPYLFWLFDPKAGEFVRNLELQKMTFPEFDANQKLIISSWKDQGNASGTDYYQWKENKPVLIRQVLQEYSDYGTYQQTLKERVGEDMKIIEQKKVDERHPPTLSLENLVRELWREQEPSVDHPCASTQKGLSGFYCHLQEILPLSKLQNLAQVPIFIQGPHRGDHLDLKSSKDFGHYNKEFVTWLGTHFIPATQDEAFKKLTQTFYDQSVRHLARIFYWAHESLLAEADYQKLTALENYQRFPTRHHSPAQKEELIEAIAFWLRRTQDGTEAEFFTHLKTLLITYDMDFALKYARPTYVGDYKTSIYPKPPEFLFKWLGNEFPNHPQLIKKIEVYKEGHLTQTLTGFESHHPPLIEDINFDGYQDIRLKIEEGHPVYYWLFDRTAEQFVRNMHLEQIPSPHFDPQKQEIQSSWHQGDHFYGTNYYRYTHHTTPLLFRQELYQVMGHDQLFTVKTILERIAKDLEVIEQKLVE